MKKRHKVLVVFSSILAALLLSFISVKLHDMYIKHEYESMEEYSHYTTGDGRYTVSLRYVSEIGLADAVRLGVYLVDNDSEDIKYISKKTLDYYDDFTPYVSFDESDDKVAVIFHNKNSTGRSEIDFEQVLR